MRSLDPKTDRHSARTVSLRSTMYGSIAAMAVALPLLPTNGLEEEDLRSCTLPPVTPLGTLLSLLCLLAGPFSRLSLLLSMN